MSERIAYSNGELLPESEFSIPAYDSGFLMGVTIAEQIRTFGGRPFWLDRHLTRFREGLGFLEIELPVGIQRLFEIVYTLIEKNIRTYPSGQELGITMFATPGPYTAYQTDETGPTFAVHTYPLQTTKWREKSQSGQEIEVVKVRQIPEECWPSSLKCRSRMHYYLASQEAQAINPNAIPLLLNQDETVSECPIANLIAYTISDGLVSPPLHKILRGVSLEYVQQIARQQGIPFAFRDLTVNNLLEADEILITSTPFCLLPVSRLNGHRIGANSPGPIFSALLSAWQKDVRVAPF